jgi:magnesium-protoporphyrin IX monomethyl ester (oxidative) cyclase
MRNGTKKLPSIKHHAVKHLAVESEAPLWTRRRTSCSGLRLALINPPQTYPQHLGAEYQSYVPVGLAMLGAVAENIGVQVEIVDCLAWSGRTIHGTSITFGLRAELLRLELEAFEPHIVGIANPFSSFKEDALATARLVKSIDPEIQVILGGIEASLSPGNHDLLSSEPALDILVRGEGEHSLCDLLEHYDLARRSFSGLKHVPGILFRDEHGQVVTTASRPFIANLDDLPFPAYHLLDLERTYANPFYARLRQRFRGGRCMPIHTSRGCPYSCTFCSVHSQVGKPNRRHTPEYVVRHMRYLMDRYDVRHFHFEDDNLTHHVERACELFEAIKPLGVSWDTPNGIRADTISPKIAEAMATSGAKSVTIAVESGDQDVLDRIIKKHLDLNDVLQAVTNLAAADIPTLAFFIVGFPGEGQREVQKTLEFAKRLAIEYGVANLLFVATPLPGTPLERECRDKGYFVAPSNNETLLSAIRLNQTPLIATQQFTKAQLFEWAKEVLDTPTLHTLGEHIPFFFANSPAGRRTFERLMGEEAGDISYSYWHAQ